MATKYYGETDRTRGVLTYSTSQSKTAVNITASSTLQAKSYYLSGYRINTYINGERVATKLSTIYDLNTSFADAFSTSSVTKSFSRKSSAYTIRVESSYAGENDPASDYFGGNKSGSTYVDITIPALDYYTITYNANGGTGAPGSQGYYYAESGSINLSSTKPTKTGYTFLGWSLSNTATSASYSAGQAWGKSNASNYTLYAVWSENYLTVMYRGNGATSATFKGSSVNVNTPLTEYFYYDNNYPDGLANVQNSSYLYLTRTNYKPTGYWGTTADGGTTIDYTISYTGQSLAKAVGKTLETNSQTVELYAQWEPDVGYINYNLNGGSGTSFQQSATIGEYKTLHPAPIRENYRFDGWSDGTNTYNAEQSYKVISSSVTMVAQWTRIYYEPVINSINGYRSNSGGDAADEGTYANITVNYTINPGGASGQADFKSITFKAGTSTLSSTKKSNTNYIVNLNGASSEVPITVTITDTKDKTASKSFTVPASFFIIDINNDGKSFAIGGGATADISGHPKGLFQIYMDVDFKGGVYGINLDYVPTSRTINGKALSSNITLTASDVGARSSTWMPTAENVGAVPTSRTVNGKALSSNISLSASDVGARPSTWTPSASDVGAVPTSRTVNGKALSSNISLSYSDVGLGFAKFSGISYSNGVSNKVQASGITSSSYVIAQRAGVYGDSSGNYISVAAAAGNSGYIQFFSDGVSNTSGMGVYAIWTK